MSKRVIFDFDGVLVDSSYELAISAYNAATDSSARTLEELPKNFLEAMMSHRYLAKNAGELVLLADVCVNGADGIEVYFKEKHALLEKELFAWGKRLFEVRTAFMMADPNQWVSLNKPFEPIFSRARAIDDCLILTNKNKSAVLSILTHNGFSIDDERIFSGDQGCSKAEHFLTIAKEFPADRYTFIDDNLNNLVFLKSKLPRELDVSLWYAEWGYGSADCERQASEEGFGIAQLNQLDDFFRDPQVD